jgi:hypothetical protein
MALESALDYSELGAGSTGQAYNEAAFRYFLAVDRTRLRRLNRSIVLVLVSLRRDTGRSAAIADSAAAALFEGLAGGVREVDFIGWYRHGRVAGAVLPQAGMASAGERRLIANRIVTSLQRSLPRDLAPRLHVRVVCLGGKVQR